MEWGGVDWSRVELSGVVWSGVGGWNGVELREVELNGFQIRRTEAIQERTSVTVSAHTASRQNSILLLGVVMVGDEVYVCVKGCRSECACMSWCVCVCIYVNLG